MNKITPEKEVVDYLLNALEDVTQWSRIGYGSLYLKDESAKIGVMISPYTKLRMENPEKPKEFVEARSFIISRLDHENTNIASWECEWPIEVLYKINNLCDRFDIEETNQTEKNKMDRINKFFSLMKEKSTKKEFGKDLQAQINDLIGSLEKDEKNNICECETFSPKPVKNWFQKITGR